MNISKAADAAKLTVKTVRYYSDIGLVSPVGRSYSGYRQYDEIGVRKLAFVRRARQFGFSINQCRELLGLYQDQNRSSADVRQIASERLGEIRKKQRELKMLHDELAHLVKACRGDNTPDCPIIDNLDKSFSKKD